MCWTSARSTRAITVTSWGSTENAGFASADHTADLSMEQMELSRRYRMLLAIAACGCTLAVAAAPAGAAPRAHSSIVGGGPANAAQWPFVVALFRKGHMHCMGSVIAPTRVLTAAHCIHGFNLGNFQVIASRPDLRNPTAGEVIPIASGRVHPDFEQTGLHDIAVVDLAQPTSAPPIALASPEVNGATTLPGVVLRVAGYGATKPFGVHLSPFLKSTIELVRTDRRCLKAYTRDLFAPESMICALGPKRKRPGRFKIHTSACAGDSGGPLVADTPFGPIVVGTVSFGGALCGLPAAPTVYSRVSSSLDFINAG
jgi:trypsin